MNPSKRKMGRKEGRNEGMGKKQEGRRTEGGRKDKQKCGTCFCLDFVFTSFPFLAGLDREPC